VYACGKVNGVYSFDERVADGRAAGEQAAGRLGFGAEAAAARGPRRLSARRIPFRSSAIHAAESSSTSTKTSR